MALLDEISAKKRALDAARPLPPEVVHDLADWYELELAVACNAVENGELTRDEIAKVLDKGPVLRNRPPAAQRLITNHVDALHLMARLSFQPNGVVTERTMAAFHSVLYQGIDHTAGKYREGPLKEGVAAGTPDPAKVRVSMSALSGWLRRTEPSVETALETHHRFMSVRPFHEGNAAVALLTTNLILNRAGYPPIVVRAEERDAYADVVERARTVGDRGPYRDLMLRLLNDSLDVCLVATARAVGDHAGTDA
ncbi:MAG TPA: Fic family protein [Azospirillum sp.]